MARIPNKTILKVLTRQIERLEKELKGHTFQYAPLEREYLIRCIQQIKNEYKDAEYLSKPVGLPMALFKSMNTEGDLFTSEP